MPQVASKRVSIIGAFLFSLVIACLLMPVGLVIWNATADSLPAPPVMPDSESDKVGATAAEFRVDESGAATYSIPIYAVPGTAGVTPKLSLNYSSQGGYGPLGKGWSIGGLSSITRCRASREAGDFIVNGVPTDGNPGPIRYGGDKVCLDGQRLITVTNSPACASVAGMSVQQLRAEIDSFQRICAYTPSGGASGPAFFTVERKDGSISWYGDRAISSDQSLVYNGYFNSTSPGKEGFALSWAQTRFQDSTGNYIDFFYYQNASGAVGEHLLKEVHYTGKTKLSGQAVTRSPYARIAFRYSARPSTEWGKGYQAGGLLTQAHRLDHIHVCNSISTCDVADQARYYKLTYASSPSGGGYSMLSSIQECGDNSAEAVCLPSTVFTWSAARNEFATAETSSPPAFAGGNEFEGMKLGDIDGDGRQDVVWLKDSTCSTEQVMVAFSDLDGSGNQTFSQVSSAAVCTPTELITPPESTTDARNLGDSSWQLFDYNGDGRDDLFVAGGGAGDTWALYASRGRATGGQQIFDTSVNLIAGIPGPGIPVDRGSNQRKANPQLADLNGDGLLDVVYKRAGALKARLMQPGQSSYAWGTEFAIVLPAYPAGNPCIGWENCTSGSYHELNQNIGTFQLHDFNGDSRSDLTLHVVNTWQYTVDEPCGDQQQLQAQVSAINDTVELVGMVQAAASCTYSLAGGMLATLVVESIGAGQITYGTYGYWPSRPASNIFRNMEVEEHFADFNGDGLADLLKEHLDSTWDLYLNTGTGYASRIVITQPPNEKQLQVADANGDGRADLLYWVESGSSKTYVARLGTPVGGFAAQSALLGGNARICTGSGCDATRHTPVFADLDGDGALDFFSLRPDSTSSLYVSRAAAGSRWTARDSITRFTNGLGAVTQLKYAPLTNAALYRRRSGTRNEVNWGRGSPVLDFMAPVYVVASASSSSPQQGDPGAMATVHYQYADAKMQAGGRGFLGFGYIVTFDPNHAGGHVSTKTVYAQNFPFVGAPVATAKRVVTGAYVVPACLAGTINNSCFAAPGAFPGLGGTIFSAHTQDWEADADSSGTAFIEFAPNVQAPLHVRTSGTVEKLYEANSGIQTSQVLTAFDYGAYGNVTLTAIDTYTGTSALVSSVSTANAYQDDNPSKWRLGRLTETAVTHERPGKTAVVRRSRFDYAMSGPATGLLVEERSQPGGPVSRDLRTLHAYDDYGNRIRTVACLPTTSNCDPATFDPAALSFHQPTLQGVHRYSRVAYDGAGRYPVKTYEPFWNGTNTVEKITQEVVSRDIFGNVTQAKDVNGVEAEAFSGALGRGYYTWTQTDDPSVGGISTLTTYRWCTQVSCPPGAKFRQQVLTTEAPSQWTYFDVLGRPVMKASATFNDGISGKDIAASCTTYDAAGKPQSMSNPFFLPGVLGSNGPTIPADACSSSNANRFWTATTYDVLDRPTVVTGPDDNTVTTIYSGLTTTIVDQRDNPTFQTRNGKGELVSVEDAHGLITQYAYYADGSLQSVSRDAGRGLVQNRFTNDVLGRKIAQDDPDTGTSTFEYNALGELVAEVDAAGNRTEHWYDARGRVWHKVVYTSTGEPESEALYVFDTAAGGVGQPAIEFITGSYVGWQHEGDSQLDFSRTYSYDAMGRPTGTTTTIDGTAYPTAVVYDARGRVWKAQDASGRWAKTAFTARGFTRAVCNSSAADADPLCAPSGTYLQTLETDPWGHTVRERRGNSAAMDVSREYWSETGRIASICAGNATTCNLMDEGYGWDGAGNLSSHQKETRYLETFAYDDLNRLTGSRRTIHNGVTDNTILQQVQYDALGNICRRLTAGWATRHYSYLGRAGCGLGDAMNSAYGSGTTNAYGAHQVGALVEPVNGHTLSHYYDVRGNQTLQDQAGTASDRTMHYSADGLAYEAAIGGQRTRFWYGSDGARYKRVDGTKKTLYLGNVEIVVDAGVTTVKRTIAGVVLQTIVGATATNHYLFHDQLGSLVRITSAAGTVIDKMDFLALGGRRNVDTQNANGTAPTLTTRGFTGHEMVDGLHLVHMNGRMYDSYQGRFMQADPMIQAPGNAQSWNAYAYAFNNPLRYTDPTGAFSVGNFLNIASTVLNVASWFFPVLAPVAQAVNYMAYVYNIGAAFQYGGLRTGLIVAFTPTIKTGNIGVDIVGNAAIAGVRSEATGGSFREGSLRSLQAAAITFTISAIAANVRSAQADRKFANGAVTGSNRAAIAGESITYDRDDGRMPYPTEGETPESRRQIFEQIVSNRSLYGIEVPEGYSIEFDDRYLSLNGEQRIFCASNCDEQLEQYGTVYGQHDPRGVITIFRAGVQPYIESGVRVVNGRITFMIVGSSPNGFQTMVRSLGHEAAHARGIDTTRTLPGNAYHPNAERAGNEALQRYLKLFENVNGR